MEGTFHNGLSTPLRRLGGHILDAFIWGLIFFIGFALMAVDSVLTMLFGLIIIFGGLGLLIFMWSKSTSPGKALLGMKVYRKDNEQPIGLSMMFVRETVGKFISGFVFSLGYIWILIDSENQGWHDKLINSVVINEKEI